jgi:choline dehydrogenase-like flavoprotein
MDIVDLNDFDGNSDIFTDICIVGSGPAGVTIAKEMLNTGIDVCIVESGGLDNESETQALYDIENVGASRKMPQELVRQRIFGGSSTTWSGRCASFNSIDFEERSWVPNSGWPIDIESLTPYLDRGSEHLGLGPNIYNEGLFDLLGAVKPKPEIDTNLLNTTFWQFSKSMHGRSNNPVIFGQDLLETNAENLRLFLHANLIHINTNKAGDLLESLDFKSLEGNKMRIFAKSVVLCCGGVENARLLLASNKIIPEGVGNKHDMVGRNLMDHVGAVIGTFDPLNSSDIQSRFGRYWLVNQGSRQSYLHGLSLGERVQYKEQLLNAAAFIEEYTAPNDPWHALKRVMTRLIKGDSVYTIIPDNGNMFWRDEDLSNDHSHEITFGNDLSTVLMNVPLILQNLYRKNIIKRPPITKNTRVDLYALIEQAPNRESRITLSSQTDVLGVPLSKINWKIDEKERTTARRLGELIAIEFKRIGLAPPELSEWLYTGDNWEANFTDRAHPTGSTSMSKNPKEGVVDINCNVHGVKGLYVAGSSTFPTAGHANPTLMIVAMAIRLADWLKSSRL